ncbi:MAG: hypothetical protein ACI96M_000414 [Candidatus Azotimanducaceae bacterium]|jgi:hypothetical protein
MRDLFYWWLENIYSQEVLPNLGRLGNGVYGEYNDQRLTVRYGRNHQSRSEFDSDEINLIWDRYCDLAKRAPYGQHHRAAFYGDGHYAHDWHSPNNDYFGTPYVPCFFRAFIEWLLRENFESVDGPDSAPVSPSVAPPVHTKSTQIPEANDIGRFADYCERVLNLGEARLSASYYYHDLHSCIVDAVFSIGANYTSTENAVRHCCESLNSRPVFRPIGTDYVNTADQMSIRDFLGTLEEKKQQGQITAETVFQNRQRTSTRNGICKSEAVELFARVLLDFGVNYFQDIAQVNDPDNLEAAIREIKGQTSGISFRYFLMLAGDDQQVKPDRMVMRFIEDALGHSVTTDAAVEMVQGAADLLSARYNQIAPRTLDHEIWKHTR